MFGAAFAAIVTGGCVSTPKPMFVPPPVPLVWPAPPARERVRYVGQIRSSADLHAPRSVWQAVGDLFAGKREPDPLYGPRDVVLTPDGQRVWVADPGGRCLHLFDLGRRTYRKFSRLGGDPLLTPVAIALGPEHSLYVCDSERNAVYRISDRDGLDMPALRLPEEIRRPVDAAFVAATQELFVVDSAAHDIKVLDESGSLRRVLGGRGTLPGEFNFPTAMVADEQRLWIADTGNYRVQCLTHDGEPLSVFGQAGDAPGDLAMPRSIALDTDGHLYVVDARFENVQIFDREGRLLLFLGEEGSGPGQFWLPGGIYIEPNGRIWVCDTYNRRIQVFQYQGDEHAGE